MDNSWMNSVRVSREYIDGVRIFMNFVAEKKGKECEISCPCARCMNCYRRSQMNVFEHLMQFGMDQSYTRWVLHGELPEYRFMSRAERLDAANVGIDGTGNDINEGDGDEEDDDMQDLLHDVGIFLNDCPINQDGRSPPTGVGDSIMGSFHELLSKANEELYPGCTNVSKLSFLIKLLHLKVYNKWSNKSFDMLLALLRDVLPNCKSLPKSYYEANQFLRSLGLGYVSIHACKYDCSLFWKEYGDLESCPKCGTSRWRINDGRGKKIPHKVLRYFPLTSRLQRLFMSSKTAKQMTWHNDRPKGDSNTMVHPSDGEAWKSFDELYHEFAREPRNVRLGLATDGFNPHGNMSLSYSVWPVVLLAYNLPPWMCMDESFFMLSLVIPGPKAVGRDIDVYMRPLVDELNELWEYGLDVFDVSKGENFRMHAALMWTINDFPAYGTIFGWSTKGYKACPVCNKHTPSCKLRSKIGYLGHRRFLPYDHPWRKSKKFDGKSDYRPIPNLPDGDDVVEQLYHVQNICHGKHPRNKRRRRLEGELNWNKKSILFYLPYWHKLRLRHNLDVMHIEKNICDNILGTLMNVEGKTKDTIKARLDLEDMNIRKELHLMRASDGIIVGKPPACYTMSSDEKKKFCEFVKQVKFPDGYASNISRCVNVDERKITGLKFHDCHILLQSILPLGTRSILNKDVTGVLMELGDFFRRICGRRLNKDEVQKMCDEITLILCKLEMIYPPAFFDVIVHLAIHLPNEVLLGGPVAYRWMYPIERFLGTLKGFVRNKARPEGSIAETYVVKECMTFCSMYLKGIETNFNVPERINDMVDGSDISVFFQQCKSIGAGKTIALPTNELQIAHWYVLMNCHEMRPFIDEHMDELKEQSPLDVDRRHKEQLSSWLKHRMTTLTSSREGNIFQSLYALACGPHSLVQRYTVCNTNGMRFRTEARDLRRITQNSGVAVLGNYGEDNITFYGLLTDIIKLEYVRGKSVVLFKCKWYDLGNSNMKVNGIVKTINVTKFWFKDDPFILANQAKQVFFVEDLILGSNWRIVQEFKVRRAYDIPLHGNEEGSNDDEESYEVPVEVGECSLEFLDRNDIAFDVVNNVVLNSEQCLNDDFDDLETSSSENECDIVFEESTDDDDE